MYLKIYINKCNHFTVEVFMKNFSLKIILLVFVIPVFFISAICQAAPIPKSAWKTIKTFESTNVLMDMDDIYETSEDSTESIYVWQKTLYKDINENQRNIQILKKAGASVPDSLSYSVELGRFFMDNNVLYYTFTYIEYYDEDGNSLYSIHAEKSSLADIKTNKTIVVPGSLLNLEYAIARNILNSKNITTQQDAVVVDGKAATPDTKIDSRKLSK